SEVSGKLNPTDRKYTSEHEWVKIEEGSLALAGITEYAQDQLGDIVYFDLPQPGSTGTHLKKMGEVESVKAVSDLFSPITGEVVEVNQRLRDHPELANEDPLGEGWLLRVSVNDLSELDQLMSAEEYGSYISAELFHDIPEVYRDPPLNLPGPTSELEVQRELAALASRNRPLNSGPSFLGAGSYNHFIPSVVKALMTRGEFLTAYTPYQAEASQGTLQVIYEFQTLISNLYGMEVANAGMYDGATSLAEGVLMACRVTRRNRVAVSDSLSPIYRQVIETYCQAQGIQIFTVSLSDSLSLDDQTASLVVQYPNFYGYIEDMGALAAAAHSQGALFVVSADPTAMGCSEIPRTLRCGHSNRGGSTFGDPAELWRPSLIRWVATKHEYIRQMPSRLSGRTVDSQGRTGYVLTLQTREQHIRRERATSNICTNEALYALASTIYLAALDWREQGHFQVVDGAECAWSGWVDIARFGRAAPTVAGPVAAPDRLELPREYPEARKWCRDGHRN
ncbi:Probable glycine dehydrogenase (decarboxylating) subunit 1, partial [Geodia barretti]